MLYYLLKAVTTFEQSRSFWTTAMLKRQLAVRLVSVKIHDAMKIALRFNIYAYDAYYLQCCLENKLPLISLDDRMCNIARSLGIKVVE